MNLSATLEDIKRLSVDERIQLAQAIWDSIDESEVPADLGLSDELKADLDRRVKELDENPDNVLMMDQLMARVRSK